MFLVTPIRSKQCSGLTPHSAKRITSGGSCVPFWMLGWTWVSCMQSNCPANCIVDLQTVLTIFTHIFYVFGHKIVSRGCSWQWWEHHSVKGLNLVLPNAEYRLSSLSHLLDSPNKIFLQEMWIKGDHDSAFGDHSVWCLEAIYSTGGLNWH